MTTVLGIDAAWTHANPSGVALIVAEPGGQPRLAAAAPSYCAFIQLAGGQPVDWGPQHGGNAIAADLIGAARLISGTPDVISVDMPVATVPIVGRRAADNDVSRQFGAAGCGTHSPSAQRPGRLGQRFSQQFSQLGFRLATAPMPEHPILPALIEVYPHVALLTLCGDHMRLPYKASKTANYWPDTPIQERVELLLATWTRIRGCLSEAVLGVADALPLPPPGLTFSALKSYEDALDAAVCAWVGLRYARGCAQPFGDVTSAIWAPTP